jgi:hypothetical protein
MSLPRRAFRESWPISDYLGLNPTPWVAPNLKPQDPHWEEQGCHLASVHAKAQVVADTYPAREMCGAPGAVRPYLGIRRECARTGRLLLDAAGQGYSSARSSLHMGDLRTPGLHQLNPGPTCRQL